jgi:hypothetical protein
MAFIAAAVVAAVVAGTGAYMASEARQQQVDDQKKMSRWQQDVEEQQAAAVRKQVRLKAERHLNAQAARAGGAGVVAAEGSLLVNQLEAASLAQYEEDLAAYGHDLSALTRGYETKLFKNQARRLRSTQYAEVGLSAAAAGSSAYASGIGSTPKSTTGNTVATSGTTPYWDY